MIEFVGDETHLIDQASTMYLHGVEPTTCRQNNIE